MPVPVMYALLAPGSPPSREAAPTTLAVVGALCVSSHGHCGGILTDEMTIAGTG